jgi:hypothetical protein
MPETLFNKYRAAIEVLQRGRDVLVESLADDILDQGEEFSDGGFLFNEFLETQGTRIHFLSLLIGQLEQSAEAYEEARPAPPPPAPKPRTKAKQRSRAKKIPQRSSQEKSADDL